MGTPSDAGSTEVQFVQLNSFLFLYQLGPKFLFCVVRRLVGGTTYYLTRALFYFWYLVTYL